MVTHYSGETCLDLSALPLISGDGQVKRCARAVLVGLRVVVRSIF